MANPIEFKKKYDWEIEFEIDCKPFGITQISFTVNDCGDIHDALKVVELKMGQYIKSQSFLIDGEPIKAEIIRAVRIDSKNATETGEMKIDKSVDTGAAPLAASTDGQI